MSANHLFAERANLQAIADASARAGAARLDTARMYADGTGAVFLSPAEAAAAARDYASYHGLASDAIDTAADDHAVSELVTDRTGASSPFGDLVFPLPSTDLPYVHPVTVVNR